LKSNRSNADRKASCTEITTLLEQGESETEGGGTDTEQAYEDDVLNETQFTDVENSFQLHHNNNKSANDSMFSTKGRPSSPLFHSFVESKTNFKVGDILSTSG